MRSFTSALLALLILATPAFAQQPLSPADFRDAAIALIRHADPGAEVELRDDLGVNIRSSRIAERPEYFVNFDTQFLTVLDELRVSGNSLSLTPLGCQNGQVVEIVLAD